MEILLWPLRMLRMRDETEAERVFRERLAAKIAEAGVSMKEIRKATAGISRQSVYRIVQGQTSPTLSVASRLANALGVPLGQLLGETEPAALAFPREAQEAAEELARHMALVANEARRMSDLMSSPSPLTGPVVNRNHDRTSNEVRSPLPSEVRERVLPFPGRPSINLAEIEADLDEPREVHWTEVPVVAFAAAGEGREITEQPTGETRMLLNTSARLVLEGKLFVSRVVGDSMEPDFRDGDFVLFERVTPSTVKRGAVVFVLFDGQPMLKILDFERRDDGHLSAVRLVSLNAAPLSPVSDRGFVLLGRVVEKLAGVPNYRHVLER
jgi:phage repressor protein C with HTH and peptisase S24 domain/transcriptional regulator with XRE-family HTH domain